MILAYVLLLLGAINLLAFLACCLVGRKRNVDRIATMAYVQGYTRGCDDVVRDFRAKEPYAAKVFALGEVVRRTEKSAREGLH